MRSAGKCLVYNISQFESIYICKLSSLSNYSSSEIQDQRASGELIIFAKHLPGDASELELPQEVFEWNLFLGVCPTESPFLKSRVYHIPMLYADVICAFCFGGLNIGKVNGSVHGGA